MDTFIAKISGMLKQLRSQRAWSLDMASQKTGVSKAMLGQIERGESSPTIATLWKIATGFGVSFSSFVEDLEGNDADFLHRKADLKQIHKKDDKIRVLPIFSYDENLKFEVFVIELLPGCEHLSPPHQKGVIEHLIVSKGNIEVLVKGLWHPLHEKEGLRFNADKPHGYRNRSSSSAIFHDIIHYPL